MQGSKASALSAGDWEDSFTNISVGDLLFDAPDDEETDCIDSALRGSSHFLQQMPLSCDSFDAAIAAHIYKHQSKADSQMALPPQASSIWNAEDTCDAFAFKKNVVFSDKAQHSSSNVGAENSQRIAQSSSLVLDAGIKVYVKQNLIKHHFVLLRYGTYTSFLFSFAGFAWEHGILYR